MPGRRNAFCATFLGQCNLVAGRVVSLQPGGCVVEAMGAQLHIGSDLDAVQAPAAGTQVQLAIRPHQLSLEPVDGASVFEVKAVSSEYLGSVTRIRTVHASGQDLTVEAPGRRRVAAGEALALHWPLSEAWVLPA